jgi:hypothetical protein
LNIINNEIQQQQQSASSFTANRGRPVSGDSQMILQQLQDTKHGEHNILIYPDLDTLNEVMATHYKEALEDRNELALFVTHYQTIPYVRKKLLERGELDIAKYEQEGSLVLYDSVKGYQTSSQGVYSIMALINMLIERVKKLGKSGMFGMADMGSFFLFQRIEQLLSYELSLPSIWDNMKLRSFCMYHEGDFSRMTEQERQALIDHHYKYIKMH